MAFSISSSARSRLERLAVTALFLAATLMAAPVAVHAATDTPEVADKYCKCGIEQFGGAQSGCSVSAKIYPNPVSGDDAEAKCKTFCAQLPPESDGAKHEYCGVTSTNPSAGEPLNKDCPPGTPEGVICVVNPLGIGVTSLPVIIGRILTAALGILGSIALLMFIYGGITWLTSGGATERIQKGKDIMKWAALGIVLIFASAALVRFVLSAFTSL